MQYFASPSRNKLGTFPWRHRWCCGGKWHFWSRVASAVTRSFRWSQQEMVTRYPIVQSSPNRIFWQGFLSLVDLIVLRGKVSILGGLLNRSKATIVSSETYHLYSMINFFGSVVLFSLSQTQSTVSIRWKNEQKHWQCSWETLWPTKEKKEETCSVTCDFSVTR